MKEFQFKVTLYTPTFEPTTKCLKGLINSFVEITCDLVFMTERISDFGIEVASTDYPSMGDLCLCYHECLPQEYFIRTVDAKFIVKLQVEPILEEQ